MFLRYTHLSLVRLDPCIMISSNSDDHKWHTKEMKGILSWRAFPTISISAFLELSYTMILSNRHHPKTRVSTWLHTQWAGCIGTPFSWLESCGQQAAML